MDSSWSWAHLEQFSNHSTWHPAWGSMKQFFWDPPAMERWHFQTLKIRNRIYTHISVESKSWKGRFRKQLLLPEIAHEEPMLTGEPNFAGKGMAMMVHRLAEDLEWWVLIEVPGNLKLGSQGKQLTERQYLAERTPYAIFQGGPKGRPWTRSVAQAIEHLLCKCEGLSSNPSPPYTQR
jgi:hypothetical protein